MVLVMVDSREERFPATHKQAITYKIQSSQNIDESQR